MNPATHLWATDPATRDHPHHGEENHTSLGGLWHQTNLHQTVTHGSARGADKGGMIHQHGRTCHIRRRPPPNTAPHAPLRRGPFGTWACWSPALAGRHLLLPKRGYPLPPEGVPPSPGGGTGRGRSPCRGGPPESARRALCGAERRPPQGGMHPQNFRHILRFSFWHYFYILTEKPSVFIPFSHYCTYGRV